MFYTKEDQTIRCLLCGINQIRKTDTLEGDTVKHFLDAAASQYFIYSNFTIQTLILGVGESNLIRHAQFRSKTNFRSSFQANIDI